MPMMNIFLCCLAAIGAICIVWELVRFAGRRRMRFTCLLFGDAARERLDARDYEIILLCRTELQEQELIRRLSEGEKRKIYIRRW